MAMTTKLSTYARKTGSRSCSAARSALCGTFNSSTRIVIRIAITPSLKALIRSVLIVHPPSVVLARAQYARPLHCDTIFKCAAHERESINGWSGIRRKRHRRGLQLLRSGTRAARSGETGNGDSPVCARHRTLVFSAGVGDSPLVDCGRRALESSAGFRVSADPRPNAERQHQ